MNIYPERGSLNDQNKTMRVLQNNKFLSQTEQKLSGNKSFT